VSYIEAVRKELEELHKLEVAPATFALRKMNAAEIEQYQRGGLTPSDCASVLMELA
jgi:hypothetical protein